MVILWLLLICAINDDSDDLKTIKYKKKILTEGSGDKGIKYSLVLSNGCSLSGITMIQHFC